MDKILILFFGMLSLGCAVQSPRQDLTTQTFSNNSLQFYQDLSLQFLATLQGSTDCASSQTALMDLVGTMPCTNGGGIETTLTNFVCEEVGGLSAQANVSQSFNACQEVGENLQGLIETQLNWDGTVLDSRLSAGGFFYNGFPQSFNDLTIRVAEGEPSECSGVLITDGQVCSPTPNCAFCPL